MIGPTGIWSNIEAKPENYPYSEVLADKLLNIFAPREWVIDFGCGDGYYLHSLKLNGFDCVIGIEGHINPSRPKFIFNADISQPRQYPFHGQVMSLEVGEHIPVEFEQNYIDNLSRHCASRMVISWAVPGQNGIGHVNCRENSYVIDQMEKRGLKLNDKVTAYLREGIEMHVRYFENTLMVFDKVISL
jgi:hypothetical protein